MKIITKYNMKTEFLICSNVEIAIILNFLCFLKLPLNQPGAAAPVPVMQPQPSGSPLCGVPGQAFIRTAPVSVGLPSEECLTPHAPSERSALGY